MLKYFPQVMGRYERKVTGGAQRVTDVELHVLWRSVLK